MQASDTATVSSPAIIRRFVIPWSSSRVIGRPSTSRVISQPMRSSPGSPTASRRVELRIEPRIAVVEGCEALLQGHRPVADRRRQDGVLVTEEMVELGGWDAHDRQEDRRRERLAPLRIGVGFATRRRTCRSARWRAPARCDSSSATFFGWKSGSSTLRQHRVLGALESLGYRVVTATQPHEVGPAPRLAWRSEDGMAGLVQGDDVPHPAQHDRAVVGDLDAAVEVVRMQLLR